MVWCPLKHEVSVGALTHGVVCWNESVSACQRLLHVERWWCGVPRSHGGCVVGGDGVDRVLLLLALVLIILCFEQSKCGEPVLLMCNVVLRAVHCVVGSLLPLLLIVRAVHCSCCPRRLSGSSAADALCMRVYVLIQSQLF